MRLAIALALLAAPAFAQDRALTPEQARGKALFDATCGYCHGPRGFGTEALAKRLGAEKSVIERRSDMPAEYIRAVVKRGLGAMPAYTPTDLTAAELAAVTAYLRRSAP